MEEKNGSIIRRLIGYNRYEGWDAYHALAQLYAVLRLNVNFFQPSLKLLSKKREGAKVTKKYDKAKTPYQRLLASEHVSTEIKENLIEQNNNLDPIKLLKELKRLQDNFWKYAWKIGTATHEVSRINSGNQNRGIENPIIAINNQSQTSIKRYRYSSKPRNKLEPRTWYTKDPFETVWNKVQLQMEINPQWTTKVLFTRLLKENPKQFKPNQFRSFQRRVSAWRKQQIKIN